MNMDKEKIKSFIGNNIVVVVLVLLCLGFGLANATFFTGKNVTNILGQMCINLILAAGLTYVIILGGIDISVGSVAAVAGVISAYAGLRFPDMGAPFAIVILVASGVVTGFVCGFINGYLIAYLNVIPMICTLSTMTIWRGVSFIITGGKPVYGLPTSFAYLGAKRVFATESMPNGAIPVITIFTVIVIVIMHILLSRTVFGRHVFASGSNRQVAHLSGIRVKRVTLVCHILCSIMAALAGVCIASKLQNAQPNAGNGYEMFAIASTVLGGTSLTGGVGSVARAIFGCSVIAVIKTGMDLMNIYSYWQNVVIGVIIILAVVLDMTQKKASR
ncbi:MAG: ABC transporter permease [Fusobacteriaceae bacterium]|jgi:ribose transport system permease protein|nr:ABC transporter permease [Fusobacteriaceae bacterium]